MSQPFSTQIQSAALSSVGRIRTGNEDSFGECAEAGVFVVCDGMGGAAAGEIASRMTVDSVIGTLCRGEEAGSVPERLAEAVEEANALVHQRGAADRSLSGMGTTLVVLQLVPGHAYVAHVGDSRIYLFRSRTLVRCTQDHSLVDEQVRMGHLTPQEAEQSPYRNIITRAIGTQPSVAPDISEAVTEAGDVFLLCSDGLIREVSDPAIESVLRETPDLDAACRRLIDAANEAGGHDNITCLLVRVPE
ncbi:Stp1/IreP family PP2C-type Ser/Thr phosphatase [Acidipila sp. 4G-K13]|uniref:Stp1/IreP family PP2C-type Ser/Thr phosphatase n=2 Tax=Paracidobacterium acidisoli TaxID=2303751 RepID=A0A372IKK3_9BACT|nr:Stp1/IreP family PP2C-type Ser/Thr phosphatase [Paracidobacterium acidisoli]MBT9332828.1 Stp1/IreP family PP2C-type Ser/Thr phosphatase [Paracidobacterium acidisoli]